MFGGEKGKEKEYYWKYATIKKIACGQEALKTKYLICKNKKMTYCPNGKNTAQNHRHCRMTAR
jgi:hypothetical protein